jgi:hypothetical protein
MPWTEASRRKDRSEVSNLKKLYFENDKLLIEWMQETINRKV